MVQPPDDDADPRDGGRGDEPAASGPVTPGGGHGQASGPPDETPDDMDARWAAIVAELGESAVDWPGDERPGDDPGERRAGHVVRGAEPAAAGPVLSGRDWEGTAQYDAAEEAVDEQEHFVPPDPGPVVTGDPLRLLTWAVAIGVPVLYVVLLVAWRNPPGWLAPVAGVLLVAAVGVLVWRMPHRRDHDNGDSGAVV